MFVDATEVAASFILNGYLFVVTRRGTIYRFEGHNAWTQCAYLPALS